MTDYQVVINRIKNIYSSMNSEEQIIMRTILQEIYECGESKTYEELWLADYKEIPVDKTTFLTDDYYLGRSNDNGKSIYPRWLEVMQELERTGNQYYEIVFTGATRTGKTSTAVSDACYQLYRLMCLRDPQKYFGLKSVTTISFFFFNLTATLARGVAFRELNDTISSSPWFMEHGKMSRSESHPTYIPEGGLISIEAGSDASHALGKATFCVVGSTEILTSLGKYSIEKLEGQTIQVIQISNKGEAEYAEAHVIKTNEVYETIKIELEDGTIIEGTPDHKVMLSDGTYKKLSELTNSDDLKTFDLDEGDHMNLKNIDAKFKVYVHTSPYGKKYVGITSIPVDTRWCHGYGYKDNRHFWNAIQKYGWDSFIHEIVAEDLTLFDAELLEIDLIKQYNTTDPNYGYNVRPGGDWSASWNKGLTKETNASVASTSAKLKHRHFSTSTIENMSKSKLKLYADGYSPVWINNGKIETHIDSSKESIPDGFKLGRLNRKRVYIYKGNDIKYVEQFEVNHYLDQGYQLGRGSSVKESIRKSLQICYFVVDDIRFETAQSAAEYLHTVGYPDIVSSTITQLCRNGFNPKSKYYSLKDRLYRVDINHEN